MYPPLSLSLFPLFPVLLFLLLPPYLLPYYSFVSSLHSFSSPLSHFPWYWNTPPGYYSIGRTLEGLKTGRGLKESSENLEKRTERKRDWYYCCNWYSSSLTNPFQSTSFLGPFVLKVFVLSCFSLRVPSFRIKGGGISQRIVGDLKDWWQMITPSYSSYLGRRSHRGREEACDKMGKVMRVLRGGGGSTQPIKHVNHSPWREGACGRSWNRRREKE